MNQHRQSVDKVLTQVQVRQDVLVTAGVASPADLTGQMAAALVAGSLAMRANQRNANFNNIMAVAKRLYNVTMSTEGVVEHPRTLWQSDSFYDDRAWAVRLLVLLFISLFL